MTVTYKVLVIRTDTSRSGRFMNGEPMPEVLFEAGSPDAGRLLAYAPNEVAAALTAAGYAEVPQKVSGLLVDTEALGEALATGGVISVGPGQIVPADEPEPRAVDEPAEQFGATPAETKPKRKRRTQAEIAADKAAAEALALASQQGANPSPENEAAIAEAAAVPAEAPPAVAESAPAQQPEAAPAAPTVPYNPFA